MRYPFAALAVVAALAAMNPAAAQRVQRIAAIVNDDVVSVFDLHSRMRLVVLSAGLKMSRKMQRRLTSQVLHGLIDERLQMQEAKRRNISISKRNLRRAVTRIEKQNKIRAGQLKQFLAANKVPVQTVINQLRARIAWGKLVNRRLRPRVAVSAEEIDESLARMKSRQGQLEYRISEILLTNDATTGESEIRRIAERLVEQIRGGARFASLARQFSRSASAGIGGDLGWIHQDDLARDLAPVVARLKPGQVSDPLTTVAGVQIVKLADQRRILVEDPANAAASLHRILLPLPRGATRVEIENQRQLALTLAGTVSGCADMARAAREVHSPGKTAMGTMKPRKLAPRIRAAIRGLAVGKPSAPVLIDAGFIILMVCSRDAVRTTLPSRKDVESQLTNAKLNLMARRYMRDLRYAAVVDLRI